MQTDPHNLYQANVAACIPNASKITCRLMNVFEPSFNVPYTPEITQEIEVLRNCITWCWQGRFPPRDLLKAPGVDNIQRRECMFPSQSPLGYKAPLVIVNLLKLFNCSAPILSDSHLPQLLCCLSAASQRILL